MLKSTLVITVVLLLVVTSLTWSGTPFGDDDTGFIPPDSPRGPITKCVLAVSKNVRHLIDCIMKCHSDRALGKIINEGIEDECEHEGVDGRHNGCQAKYENQVFTIITKGMCPPCLLGTAQPDLAISTESQVDANNGSIYCASPGNAFIDGLSGF
jgi:hypothetical protein